MKYLIYAITLLTGNTETSYSKLMWTEATEHCENKISKQECKCNDFDAVYYNFRNEFVIRQITGTDTVFTRLNGQPVNIVWKGPELNFK